MSWDWVLNNIDGILAVCAAIVPVASAICALTPTPKDDVILGELYKIIEALALNVGKAKDTAE